jgi:hypothetical protein
MGAAVFVARQALIHLGLPVGARLVVLIVAGALAYLALTLLLAPDLLQDARDSLLRRRVATA